MKKALWFKLYGILVIGLALLLFSLSNLPDGLLHIWFFDIGQGDAIFIQTPDQQRILIDGGPDDKIIQRLSEKIPFYIRKIDFLMVSHPHADHLNGLIEVLKRYEVNTVFLTGVSYGYAGYTKFLELIREKGIQIIFVNGTSDFQLGKIFLDILYPFSSLQGAKMENLNNSSIVLRLILGNYKFFFSGDLEMEKEQELIKTSLDLKANMMKAGHHGSRTSNTPEILERIQPELAVISCGVNNPFHHPAPVTIENFQKRKVSLYRTDLDGTIEVITDGKKIFQVKTQSL